MRENYTTFAETEAILKIAIRLPGNTIKDIAKSSGINASSLYKVSSSNSHLSPQKADKLLLYFIHSEPERLNIASILYHKDINI